MVSDERFSGSAESPDARAAALAHYLRERAASFSMSADVTGAQDTAHAGMALLDAASIADAMLPTDHRLRALSEAGVFESMPDRQARFLETPEIRATVQRPLLSGPQTGAEILAQIVDTARGYDEPPRTV